MTNPATLKHAGEIAYPGHTWKLGSSGKLYGIDNNPCSLEPFRHFDPINNDSDFKALWVGLCKMGFIFKYDADGFWKADYDFWPEPIPWNRDKSDLVLAIQEPTPELAALKLVEILNNSPEFI